MNWKKRFTSLLHTAPATIAVLILMLVFTGLEFFVPFEYGSAENMIACGAYYKALVSAGEWWRLLSASFVHSGWMHLLMNGWSLLMIGPITEQIYGRLKYLLILLGSSIGGYLYLFAADGNNVSLGLSGGLYGLLGILLVNVFASGSWKNRPLRRSVLQMILVNLLINFMPNVAWKVHLGGLFAGLLLGMVLSEAPFFRMKTKETAAALAVYVLLLGYGVFRNRTIPENEIYGGTDIRILRFEKDMGLESHALKTAQNLDEAYSSGNLFYNAVKEN